MGVDGGEELGVVVDLVVGFDVGGGGDVLGDGFGGLDVEYCYF